MAQFDYFAEPRGAGFWLDCQNDWWDDFATRLVAPLIPCDIAPKVVRQLNPVFAIGGERFALFPQLAGSLSIRDLRKPAGSLAMYHHEIVGAFDFLITGV
jgi:toxin CcdB